MKLDATLSQSLSLLRFAICAGVIALAARPLAV